MGKELIKSIEENQSAIEKCLLDGDLSKLSDDQRASYYNQVCETVGLNPLTQPFQYIYLNNKLKMYALKGATDQLRRIYNISCEVKNREKIEDLYTVTVKATIKETGRVDEDMGFAKISGLKGDNLGNAMCKATTKAKRRVTLSMCGLGMLDEDEIASIPDDTGDGKGKKKFNPSATKGSEKETHNLKNKLKTESREEKISQIKSQLNDSILVDIKPEHASSVKEIKEILENPNRTPKCISLGQTFFKQYPENRGLAQIYAKENINKNELDTSEISTIKKHLEEIDVFFDVNPFEMETAA